MDGWDGWVNQPQTASPVFLMMTSKQTERIEWFRHVNHSRPPSPLKKRTNKLSKHSDHAPCQDPDPGRYKQSNHAVFHGIVQDNLLSIRGDPLHLHAREQCINLDGQQKQKVHGEIAQIVQVHPIPSLEPQQQSCSKEKDAPSIHQTMPCKLGTRNIVVVVVQLREDGRKDEERKQNFVRRNDNEVRVLVRNGSHLPHRLSIERSHPTQLLLKEPSELFRGFGVGNRMCRLDGAVPFFENQIGEMPVVTGSNLSSKVFLMEKVLQQTIVQQSLAVDGEGTAATIHAPNVGHGTTFDIECVAVPRMYNLGQPIHTIENLEGTRPAPVPSIPVDGLDELSYRILLQNRITVNHKHVLVHGVPFLDVMEPMVHDVSFSSMCQQQTRTLVHPGIGHRKHIVERLLHVAILGLVSVDKRKHATDTVGWVIQLLDGFQTPSPIVGILAVPDDVECNPWVLVHRQIVILVRNAFVPQPIRNGKHNLESKVDQDHRSHVKITPS